MQIFNILFAVFTVIIFGNISKFAKNLVRLLEILKIKKEKYYLIKFSLW